MVSAPSHIFYILTTPLHAAVTIPHRQMAAIAASASAGVRQYRGEWGGGRLLKNGEGAGIFYGALQQQGLYVAEARVRATNTHVHAREGFVVVSQGLCLWVCLT